MYRAIVIPTEKEHTIDLPEKFFGKKVEVLINEIFSNDSSSLPKDLKNKAFWEDIEFNPNFPSVEEIRKTAWPKREL
jgi:hypothetical protein